MTTTIETESREIFYMKAAMLKKAGGAKTRLAISDNGRLLAARERIGLLEAKEPLIVLSQASAIPRRFSDLV